MSSSIPVSRARRLAWSVAMAPFKTTAFLSRPASLQRRIACLTASCASTGKAREVRMSTSTEKPPSRGRTALRIESSSAPASSRCRKPSKVTRYPYGVSSILCMGHPSKSAERPCDRGRPSEPEGKGEQPRVQGHFILYLSAGNRPGGGQERPARRRLEGPVDGQVELQVGVDAEPQAEAGVVLEDRRRDDVLEGEVVGDRVVRAVVAGAQSKLRRRAPLGAG